MNINGKIVQNESGFYALPAGVRNNFNFIGFGYATGFWSFVEGHVKIVFGEYKYLSSEYKPLSEGYSVRCIKD
jgi:uncharacterized protein (TIGR02145 family)